MKLITKELAVKILALHKAKDFEPLNKLGLTFFGNKGRMWNRNGCLCDLDATKGKCNPRLSSNSCRDAEEFGCPECLAELNTIAES